MGGRGGCLVQANTTDMPFAMTSQPFLQKDRIGVEYLTTHTQFLLQVNGDELVSTASARGLSTICPVPLASVFVTMSRRQTKSESFPSLLFFFVLRIRYVCPGEEVVFSPDETRKPATSALRSWPRFRISG